MKSAPRIGSAFEALEDRALPTTFGVPWADPEHLTFSFVADGTPTPLGTSSLSQLLASTGTSTAWKVEVLRAFQTWAANANINIGLVADGGQALGIVGAVQGDRRFGDIRVAAAGLSPDVLASASPFSWTGTTLSGDVMVNANAPFGTGNSTSAYDLYSVLLHEAGHAFGLDHDQAAEASAIHEDYSYQTGLSATDIAHLQALYGARRAGRLRRGRRERGRGEGDGDPAELDHAAPRHRRHHHAVRCRLLQVQRPGPDLHVERRDGAAEGDRRQPAHRGHHRVRLRRPGGRRARPAPTR